MPLKSKRKKMVQIRLTSCSIKRYERGTLINLKESRNKMKSLKNKQKKRYDVIKVIPSCHLIWNKIKSCTRIPCYYKIFLVDADTDLSLKKQPAHWWLTILSLQLAILCNSFRSTVECFCWCKYDSCFISLVVNNVNHWLGKKPYSIAKPFRKALSNIVRWPYSLTRRGQSSYAYICIYSKRVIIKKNNK